MEEGKVSVKIFIPFRVKDIGGTATFAQKFAQAAEERGHTVVFDFCTDFDRMLVIADAPLWYVFFAKIKQIPIIQRLDGVYHPATPYGRWYWIYNLKMKLIHNWLANRIIYQSKFSEESCRLFLGKKARGTSTVIYNGVVIPDLSSKKFPEHQELRLVTFSKFRRRDQIEPLIEAVKRLAIPYSFTIYGSFGESVKDLESTAQALPHIQLKGKQTNEVLLKEIGDYDVFLFSDQSACPNSVLEAFAAALPVVAFERGSIDELVINGENGESVPLRAPQPYTNPYPFESADYQLMAEKIALVARDLGDYKHRARQSAIDRYSLDKMVDAYLEVVV